MNITMIGAKNFEDIGGIENHIKEISKRLVERGHRVNVIINNKGGKKADEILDGVNVYYIPYVQGRYTTKLSMLPYLLSKAKKINTDIYHAHDVVCGFGSVVFLHDKPIVYTAHGIGYLRNDWPIPIKLSLWAMEQTLFRRANKLLAVDYQTRNLLEKIRQDVKVTANGVDLNRFKERKKLPEEFDRDKLKIVFAARLIPTKGAHLLINSFNEKAAVLYIIGTGPEDEKLKRLISRKKNVKFVGLVHDIVPYFQHADIFVLPSIYEGLPIALLEAMAAETACISFKLGDLDKRFKHRHDIYFTSKEELSDSISELVTNDQLRIKISKNAKEKITKDYTWNKTVDSLIKVYDEVDI